MASKISPVNSNSGNYVFQFKISLKYPKPPIWRRVLVPGDYSFKDLHLVIQNVMGWSNTHMHKFDLKDRLTGKEIEVGGSGDFGFVKWWPESTKLNAYFKSANDKANYDYDFGCTWYHIILLEKIVPVDQTKKYPQCIAGKRATPPEHNVPEETEGFDPEFFDAKLITFKKCRDFLQDDEKEVQDQDSSYEYESDESIDFTYRPTVGQTRETSSSEGVSDPKEFSEDHQLATRKTESMLQAINNRPKVGDFLLIKNANGNPKLPQKRLLSEDTESKQLSNKIILLEYKDLQKNSAPVSETSRVIENSESLPSNSKDLDEDISVPTVAEDSEDHYGKFIASQMRDVKDLKRREELRIEIQKLISKYRFEN